MKVPDRFAHACNTQIAVPHLQWIVRQADQAIDQAQEAVAAQNDDHIRLSVMDFNELAS